MKNYLVKFKKNQGFLSIEYIMIAALIVVVMVVVALMFGKQEKNMGEEVSDNFGNSYESFKEQNNRIYKENVHPNLNGFKESKKIFEE